MLIPIVNQNDSLVPCCGKLQYVIHDYSFSFEYQDAELTNHRAWLCFGPIEVALRCLDGQLLGVSAYTGRRTWHGSTLSPVGPVQSGALTFEGFDQCQIGVGYVMEGDEFNRVNFNSTSGWAHVGNGTATYDALVEFATNCCAAICDNRVVALWLHPENWRELV